MNNSKLLESLSKESSKTYRFFFKRTNRHTTLYDETIKMISLEHIVNQERKYSSLMGLFYDDIDKIMNGYRPTSIYKVVDKKMYMEEEKELLFAYYNIIIFIEDLWFNESIPDLLEEAEEDGDEEIYEEPIVKFVTALVQRGSR